MKISRQESELLPRFHRRPCEDDSADFLVFVCKHGHCNRKICFARARRTHSENDCVVFQCVYVTLLPQCFALYLLALACECNNIIRKLKNQLRIAFPRKVNCVSYAPSVNTLTAFNQRKQFFNYIARNIHCTLLSADIDLFGIGSDVRAGFGFDYFEIFVKDAEQFYYLVHGLNLRKFGHGWFINNCLAVEHIACIGSAFRIRQFVYFVSFLSRHMFFSLILHIMFFMITTSVGLFA